MELLQSKSWKHFLILSIIFEGIFAKPQNEICQTKGCITAASKLMDTMDTTIDPCDNFFNFACGNYIKKSNLLYKDLNTVMRNMRDKTTEQLRTIVSEPENQNEIKPYKLVKQFYSQCMDGKSGVSSFLEIVDQFGGWPILMGESWVENQINVEHLFSEIQKYKNLFNFEEFADEMFKLYSNAKKYRTFMNDFINLFESSNSDKSQELDDIFNFEQKLERLMIKCNVTTETLVFALGKLQSQNMNLNWTNLKNGEINVTDFINAVGLNFFMSAGELIMSTPKRTLTNCIIWNVAKLSAKYLSKDMYYLREKYFSPNKIEARWEICLEEVKNNLNYPLSAMYIEKHFDMSIRQNIKEMIKNIRTEAIKTFKAADWMSQSTQKKLIKKLNDLEFKYVGFLNELMDSVKMKNNYADFDLPQNFFLSNLKFKHHKYIEAYYFDLNFMLQGPPFVIDAYYNSLKNSIVFPAAILHPPMYNSDRPQYMNYGAIGWIIGHEISHIFADGIEFLGEDRVKCLIDQYSRFFEPSINKTLNGAQTITEDLADNIGMKIAYNSYKNYMDLVGDEQQLPGLNYTPKQLFWITGARVWCAKIGASTAKYLFLTDVHTLAPWRVFGTFRNMVEFSEDFKCSKNSKMNPSTRCELWK